MNKRLPYKTFEKKKIHDIEVSVPPESNNNKV
jgi:hypothetical protein